MEEKNTAHQVDIEERTIKAVEKTIDMLIDLDFTYENANYFIAELRFNLERQKIRKT